jgi:hypothetical protein
MTLGEHDQTVLTGRHTDVGDTHDSVIDDGRSLKYIEPGAGAGAGADHEAYHDPDAYIDQAVFRHCDEKFIPDIVHIRTAPFAFSKWEFIYSTVFGSGLQPHRDPGETDRKIALGFEPVIDDHYRVIGHLGWISGSELFVPKDTIEWDSPLLHGFEQQRLEAARAPFLAIAQRAEQNPFSAFPIHPVSKPLPRGWKPTIMEQALQGPFKDVSEEQRIRDNMNFFLSGGGTAFVGRDFIHDEIASRHLQPYLRPGYRCMVLVSPDGSLQGVLGVEKINYESREERFRRIAFMVIDIAIYVWMVIDIVTISVAVMRPLVGATLRTMAEIRALKIVQREVAKVVAQNAQREAAAFWAAASATPRLFAEGEIGFWNRWITNRMRELGIPEKNIGTNIKRFKGGARLPGSAADEAPKPFNAAGTERGQNVRTVVVDGEVHEGGIEVHGSAFTDWSNFDLWNKSPNPDRIDAIIAHEWLEFGGLTHEQAILQFERSTLNISPGAKQILGQMKQQLLKLKP